MKQHGYEQGSFVTSMEMDERRPRQYRMEMFRIDLDQTLRDMVQLGQKWSLHQSGH